MLLMAPDIVTPTGLRPRSYLYQNGEEFSAKTGGWTYTKSSTSGGYPTTNSWYRNADNLRARVAGNASTSKFGINHTYYPTATLIPAHHTQIGIKFLYPTVSGNSGNALYIGSTSLATDLAGWGLNNYGNVGQDQEVIFDLPDGVAGQSAFAWIYSNHGQYANYDFYLKELWTA